LKEYPGKDQIKRMLEAAKVSKVKELAVIVGEKPNTLSMWKKRGVPEGEIFRISHLLGCDPEWIRTGEVEKRPAKEVSSSRSLDSELAQLALATVKEQTGDQQVELTIEEVTRELMIRSLPEEVRKSIDHAIQSAWAAEQAKQSK
jgi:hypothetical protein